MPNWCENRVTISGDTEEVQKFREVIEGPDHHGKESIFSFHQLLPMPIELIGTKAPPTVKATQTECDAYNAEKNQYGIAVTQDVIDTRQEKYGASDWYYWATENWGTKWQPTDIELDDDTNYLVYHFDTAWCPPEGIWEHIVGQFPNLRVTWFYDEPGMEFCGYLGV